MRCCACTDALRSDIANALLDLSSVKDVCFSVSKVFWSGFDFYPSLDNRVHGKIERWVNKADLRVRVRWDDGEVEPLALTEMLPCAMRLEKYADNRPAPHPKRRRNVANSAGTSSSSSTVAPPSGNAVQEQEQAAEVNLTYRRGGRAFDISWQHVLPESIQVDVRAEERWRPKIKMDKAEFKTAYTMWLNVALPMNFVKKMFGADGFINQRLSGKDNTSHHRKTSVGEGIALLGYMLAMANNPGTPIRDMWQEKARSSSEKCILPPAALGRFGISRDRFDRLIQLVGCMHSVHEGELDETDPWKYCNLPITMHNAHWKRVYEASWLLAPDESMSPFVPRCEGDGPNDLPFLSNVPRKPKPLGAEIKTVADGESGAILFMELALKYKRKRNSPQVVPPFAEQPGTDTVEAQCLRLTEPWHFSGRAVGADAHFMSVASCEALREKVSSRSVLLICLHLFCTLAMQSCTCVLTGLVPIRRCQEQYCWLSESIPRGGCWRGVR